jgi:hypothetical protein
VCVRLAASFGSYKIGAAVTVLCCRHRQTDGRTHNSKTSTGQETFTLSDIQRKLVKPKCPLCVCVCVCVYYGQSNYPKVIFTKKLAAIKEHFRNFGCFQKKFSDAPHFGCNPPPVCKSSNLYPTWPQSNDFIALHSCKIQGKKCDLRHGAQFPLLPPAAPQTQFPPFYRHNCPPFATTTTVKVRLTCRQHRRPIPATTVYGASNSVPVRAMKTSNGSGGTSPLIVMASFTVRQLSQ